MQSKGIGARGLAAAAAIGASMLAIAGCGGATKTVTQTIPTPTTASATAAATTGSNATSSTTGDASARSQNDQVISSASQAPDHQAALGAPKISKILAKKVGLDHEGNFDVGHRITASETATDSGDCYVKLGAEAVNFEDQTSNILRSPTEADIVFVQSDTTTPLVKCLEAVRGALGW